MIQGYLGLRGAPSLHDKVFACPADRFFYDFPSLNYRLESIHDQTNSQFTSYGFNGANASPNTPLPILNEISFPGVFGRKASAIKQPSKTLLTLEVPGFFPWSWHQPLMLPDGKYGINDAKNVLGYIDGHVDYARIFFNPTLPITSCNYDPPPEYDYKRSAD